jgi:transposase
MPAPYSYDLRQKAIKAVKKGEKKIRVCRMFQISRNTLDLWLKKEKETGSYEAIANNYRPTRKIQDEAKFRNFLQENEDKTQEQMAELWGDNVTQQNISYFCQKIGITRKKKPMVIRREMKKKEQNS